MASKVESSEPAKRVPPWMLMPGGPKKPNHAVFRAAVSKLVEERRALLAEVKALRAQLGQREGREEEEKELNELRARVSEIDNQRKLEQEMRFKKNEEIQRIQKIHDQHLTRLRELSDDLGGFKTLKEIDDAIAFITRKMETSGGGLSAEKRAVRQLSKLEEAKRYLVELQPLSEAISEAKHHETILQREWQEINERIRHLRTEYNEQRTTKQQKEQELRSTGANRSQLYSKCTEISNKISIITKEINALHEEHRKAMETWDKWVEEARAKYIAKMEEERKERHRRYLERKNAAKMEAKRARALRNQNPFEVEIDACRTLLRYLQDQKTMVQREEAELARKEAAATFDPSKFLPEGAVLLNDGKRNAEPYKGGSSLGKNNMKQHKQKQTAKSAAAKSRVLQHTEEKIRLFQLIKEEPPVSLTAIDESVERIRAKQKEYESHIKTGELELSSDDEEDEEEEEREQEDEAEEEKEHEDEAEEEKEHVDKEEEEKEHTDKDEEEKEHEDEAEEEKEHTDKDEEEREHEDEAEEEKEHTDKGEEEKEHADEESGVDGTEEKSQQNGGEEVENDTVIADPAEPVEHNDEEKVET